MAALAAEAAPPCTSITVPSASDALHERTPPPLSTCCTIGSSPPSTLSASEERPWRPPSPQPKHHKPHRPQGERYTTREHAATLEHLLRHRAQLTEHVERARQGKAAEAPWPPLRPHLSERCIHRSLKLDTTCSHRSSGCSKLDHASTCIRGRAELARQSPVANYANSLRAMPTDRIARVAMRLAGLHLTHMESCVCDPHAQPRRQHTSRI